MMECCQWQPLLSDKLVPEMGEREKGRGREGGREATIKLIANVIIIENLPLR